MWWSFSTNWATTPASGPTGSRNGKARPPLLMTTLRTGFGKASTSGLPKRFGADYLRRYVRAWRNDDTVRDLIAGPKRPSNRSTLVTREQRATLQVAAISAAVRQDLRSQFRTWRIFPFMTPFSRPCTTTFSRQ